MDIKQAMDIEFEDGDIGKTTIREYLKDLLATLLQEGESFSGKRPFGNSGWEMFAVKPLSDAGLLEADFDEDGYVNDYDGARYDELLQACVEEL